MRNNDNMTMMDRDDNRRISAHKRQMVSSEHETEINGRKLSSDGGRYDQLEEKLDFEWDDVVRHEESGQGSNRRESYAEAAEVIDRPRSAEDRSAVQAYQGEFKRKSLVKSESSKSQEPGFIEFRDVTKNYTMGEMTIRALDGIDFSIKQGEIVIVVGASGAGKSTILNIMGGMDRQTSGEIYVDGEKISEYNDNQMVLYRRYDVGFVFQFYNLVPNLTAKENVELATQISKCPLDVDDTMEAVGLTDRKNNFPSQLSGGEQQRVAIARALAKNPKLLLCDEPTGALDYNTGKAILKLLQDTARLNGMTVIIITHNYAITGIGDRVIKVKNGKIEAIETNSHPMDIADIEW